MRLANGYVGLLLMLTPCMAQAEDSAWDIWSGACYRSLSLVSDQWFLSGSIDVPGAAGDSAILPRAKIGYLPDGVSSRSDDVTLWGKPVSMEATDFNRLYLSFEGPLWGGTVGGYAGNLSVLREEHALENLVSYSYNAAGWYTRPAGLFRGAALSVRRHRYECSDDITNYALAYNRPLDGEFELTYASGDFDLTVSGLPTDLGVFFLRVGARGADADDLQALEREFEYCVEDSVVDTLWNGHLDTVLDRRYEEVMGPRTFRRTMESRGGRVSVGLVMPPRDRRFLSVEIGGSYVSTAYDSTVDTVAVERVTTPDERYCGGYYYRLAPDTLHERHTRIADTCAVFIDVGQRRRFTSRFLDVVVGYDGRVVLQGYREDGDPGFLKSPTYYWKKRSTKTITLALPLLLTRKIGVVTLLGQWTPSWEWHSRRMDPPRDEEPFSEDSYAYLTLARGALGIICTAGEHLTFGFVPEFRGTLSTASLDITYTW